MIDVPQVIQVEQVPFPDTDALVISDWLNSPGRLLYQRFIASQVAECMAQAENIRVTDEAADDPNNSLKPDADELTLKAKVLRAANKKLDEVVAKDFRFYTVVLKPEPTTE